MKDIFNKINQDHINISNDISDIDTDRIKYLAMKKINQNRYHSLFKKSLSIAASLALFIAISGITTYALERTSVRSYIRELFGFETGEVLLIGETISNRDYSMTVEDFIYDGVNGEVTLSISPNSNSAKKSFETDKIHDKFGHFSIGYGIGELKEYSELNKRFFSISFSKPLNKYEHLTSDLDHLVFAFKGIKDMIKIPLNPTLNSFQKDILVHSQGYYPVEYTSIVYSKLGFTLIGSQVNDNASNENMTIDFILKNGRIIHFVNSYDPYTFDTKLEPNSDNEKVSKETVIIDGKKEEVSISSNNTIEMDTNVICEFDDEWFAGSSGSGYSSSNHLREATFSFQKSFDWESVDKMIINGTEIKLN